PWAARNSSIDTGSLEVGRRVTQEIPDAPQPASVPQVQHLLGQGCTVRGLHSQRAAA
ncbi:hypothetical protein M9458_028067, partial [Cirrhinus mrigala]